MPPGRERLKLVALGAVLGLAWASGLRGWMSQLAGDETVVTWAGTFAGILLPGVVTGALLGWAEYLRRTGGRPWWRLLALAPLLMASITFLDLPRFFTEGLGSGSASIALLGLTGGYALSGRGPLWARILSGAVPLAAVLGGIVVLGDIGVTVVETATSGSAYGAWMGLYFAVFVAVFALASSIPHRSVVQAPVATVVV